MLKDESGFLPTAAGGECQSVSEEEAVTCYVDHRPFDAILKPRDTEMGLCNKVFFFCFFFTVQMKIRRPNRASSGALISRGMGKSLSWAFFFFQSTEELRSRGAERKMSRYTFEMPCVLLGTGCISPTHQYLGAARVKYPARGSINIG